ncbi:MAG: peptidase MA family metallohydrolase [Planctomycetota bacterium]|jgi:hypothetical protein
MTIFSRLILQTFLSLPLVAQDPGIQVLPGSADIDPRSLRLVEKFQTEGLERLAPYFPDAVLEDVRIYVHRNLDSIPGEIRRFFHRGTAGLALLEQNLIFLLLEEANLSPPGDLRSVVDHELVHLLLHAHSREAGSFVPRWFHEGLAQELSGATYFGVSEEEIILPARMRKLLRFIDLRSSFPSEEYSLRLAYAQSFSYVSYLTRQHGVKMLLRAVQGCDSQNWFRAGFLSQAGTPLILEEEAWLDYLENESGAFWRRLQSDCFFYLMIPGSILLAWAAKKAMHRDRRTKLRLEEEDRIARERAERSPQIGEGEH